MILPESDTGIYVVSGIFVIVAFAVAVAVAVGRAGIDLTTTVLTLSVGFVGFVGVYFIAMVVYRGIERGEEAR